VVLLLARDIAITGLRSIAASEDVVIAAGEGGKAKTALQMVGILMLMIGYPYRMHFLVVDLGVVDLVHVGRWLIYISLVYSLASAAQYVGLFATTVEARRRRERHP
jgi:CDP-diacylglycerol--glycerol-3-phosphate 3-phosphatidyltransferase